MFLSRKNIFFVNQKIQLKHSSTLAFSQILYSLSHIQSCCYIDFSNKNQEYLSLLEQLFLRTDLEKEFPHIHIDYYLKHKEKSITRGIIAQGEFQNIHIESFLEVIEKNSYNTIIIDNLTPQIPNFDLIIKLIESSKISSHILIIGNSEVKKYIKSEINEEFELDESSLFKPKYENIVFPLPKFSNQNYIECPKNFSSWIIITINFYLIKYPISKRFFFNESIEKVQKEIFLISNFKNKLKLISEYGDWDFVFNQNNLSNIENKVNNSLLYQSLKIPGLTNIISSENLILDNDNNKSIILTNYNIDENKALLSLKKIN